MNINEIARMAGVSASAVSRYLNNGYVSDEKKEVIRKVIEETGYQPSRQAQRLRTGRTQVIGVVVPKISSESIGKIVGGISEVLSEADYMLLLSNTENEPEKELQYLQLLNNNPVDGIIFIATIFSRKHKEVLAALNVPVVIIGQLYEDYPCIYHDDFGVAKELTKKLLRSGKHHPGGIFVTEKDKAAGEGRKQGFMAALQEQGMDVQLNHMVQGDFDIDSGYEGMKLLLEQYPQVDSVFCAVDSIAVGALEYVKERGMNIPQDIGFAGVGASRLASVVTPRLTTGYLHYETSGREGAKLLLDMLETSVRVPKQIKLGYGIIDGNSI